MKIAAVRHAIPSRRFTNLDVIDQVRKANGSRPMEEMKALEDRILGALATAGTDVRYALADGEKAVDIAVRAGRDALSAASVAPADVDFLLYAGVGRGWLEPATAPAVQARLGLDNATSFDVLDACASWLRSLHVAHAYLRSGTYRCGMIVNAECGHYRAYQDWKFEDAADLEVRFGSYTIGEAATATIVVAGGSVDDFHFRFRTLAEHVDLCMIPLPNVADFLADAPAAARVPGRFFSRPKELFTAATTAIVDEFHADPELSAGSYDVAFGHDATVRVAHAIARAIGCDDVYFSTHREFGNTVSASVPLAMSVALDRGKLRRGDRVLVALGSAGLTVGFASFTF